MEQVVETLLRHRAKLLGFIRKRVYDPDLAEDVLQEGLIKALRSASDLREEEKLLPWFYQILRNAVIDTYRKHNVEERHLESMVRDLGPETTPADEAALCECFRSLLPSLKPEYAELIERLELLPEDPSAVAKQLKILPNNLKVRRHRARQALKRRLEETCRTCATHGCLDCTCHLDNTPHGSTVNTS